MANNWKYDPNRSLIRTFRGKKSNGIPTRSHLTERNVKKKRKALWCRRRRRRKIIAIKLHQCRRSLRIMSSAFCDVLSHGNQKSLGSVREADDDDDRSGLAEARNEVLFDSRADPSPVG